MLKIYLLRHGETQHNLKHIVQGRGDSPLTIKGVRQVTCAGIGARDISFTAAYSGLLQRQIDTAKAFLSMNRDPISIQSDAHFNEMDYGKYDGGTYEDLLGPLYEELGLPYNGYEGLYKYYNDLEIAERLMRNDETGTFEGADRVRKRFMEGLEMIAQRYTEGNILVSTSSFAIVAVCSGLDPDALSRGLPENASLTSLVYEEGRFFIERFGDISFRQNGERLITSK